MSDRRPSTNVLLLLCGALALAAGCNGGGGGGSSRSAAAAVTSGTTGTPGSATTPGTTSSAPRGTFTRTFGGREYVLHVPQSHATATRALPLVVGFHGSGDTARNFFDTMRVSGWVQAAETAGVILVVPATKSPYQTFPVWSGNPNNDLPQMQTELAEVLALVDQDVATTWRVDAAHVHGLGFSDGGLFLGAVGLPSPRFATATILGYGWGAFDIQPIAQRRPVQMACGTADQFFNGAQQTQAFLASRGHDVRWTPVQNVGHTFIGLSAPVDPAAALAWMLARPAPGGTPITPGTGTPPAAGAGSGGTGGAVGLSTRTVTANTAGAGAVSVSYDVFVPSGYSAATPIPVVFAVNMGLTPWQALAQSETFIAVDLRDHDRNGGFRFDVDVAVLDAVYQDVLGAWNVNTKRVYYHGFSAGAHFGYAVVLANSTLFAGLAINAGSMQVAIQQGIWPGLVTRKLPVAIRHGTQDTVVPVQAGRDDRTRLQGAGHPVLFEEFAGGHTAPTAQDALALWNFLKTYSAP